MSDPWSWSYSWLFLGGVDLAFFMPSSVSLLKFHCQRCLQWSLLPLRVDTPTELTSQLVWDLTSLEFRQSWAPEASLPDLKRVCLQCVPMSPVPLSWAPVIWGRVPHPNHLFRDRISCYITLRSWGGGNTVWLPDTLNCAKLSISEEPV